MISLFLKPPAYLKKNIVFPRMSYIQDRYAQNLKIIKEYYIKLRKPVPSNHPLVTFLNTTLVSTHSVDSFVSSALQNGYATGSSLQMSSFAYQHGWQRKNWYYSDIVREYIFIETTSAESIQGKWQDLEPVTVKYHPRSDVSYRVLDGTQMSDEIGYAVICVDPVALIYQYREWWKTQLLLPPEKRLRVAHFVGMYVLPGMISSHLDVAFVNRIKCHLTGQMPAVPFKQNLTSTAKTINQVDDTCSSIVSKLTAGDANFTDMVQLIKGPSGRSLHEIVMLPQDPPTMSVKTYRALLTIPYMELLAALDILGNQRVNNTHYSEWLTVIKRLKNESWLRGLSYMEDQLLERIEENIVAYIP